MTVHLQVFLPALLNVFTGIVFNPIWTALRCYKQQANNAWSISRHKKAKSSINRMLMRVAPHGIQQGMLQQDSGYLVHPMQLFPSIGRDFLVGFASSSPSSGWGCTHQFKIFDITCSPPGAQRLSFHHCLQPRRHKGAHPGWPHCPWHCR